MITKHMLTKIGHKKTLLGQTDTEIVYADLQLCVSHI